MVYIPRYDRWNSREHRSDAMVNDTLDTLLLATGSISQYYLLDAIFTPICGTSRKAIGFYLWILVPPILVGELKFKC